MTTKEAIGVAIEVMKLRLSDLRKDLAEYQRMTGYICGHISVMIYELESAIAKLEQYHE